MKTFISHPAASQSTRHADMQMIEYKESEADQQKGTSSQDGKQEPMQRRKH